MRDIANDMNKDLRHQNAKIAKTDQKAQHNLQKLKGVNSALRKNLKS